MPRYYMPQSDATAVVLPQYREAVVRPYQPGDYTTPSSKSELRQLDRPPPLEFQMQTAGENYGRGHDFFKEQFDRTGLTEAAADARDYYDNELYLTHPALAAVGSTLAGEAFDFWRDAVTDPINVATAGMGTAPKVGLGAVSMPTRYGRVELPYRTATRSRGGVHQLEESLVKEALPSSGISTSGLVKGWSEKLEPRYLDGDFKGQKVITLPPDINVLESPDVAAHAGQMYKEQLKGIANAKGLLDYMPLYRSMHHKAPAVSKLGEVLKEFETNPPGPNVMQDMLHRQYRGPLLDKVSDQLNFAHIQDVLAKNKGDLPAEELTRLIDELQLYNAAATGKIQPWRPLTASLHTPLGTIQAVPNSETVGLQAYKLAKGAVGSTPVSHLPTTGGKEHTMLYAKGKDIPPLVDPSSPLRGGRTDGLWNFPANPMSYLPANAPLGGHLMSAVARDFSLPHTYRMFDATTGEYFLKHEPEAWLASIKGHPLERKILEAQADAIRNGVIRSEQPSLGTLALTSPEIMPYTASNLGLNFAVSANAPNSGKLSEMLLPLDKTYDSYKGAPDRVISAQRGGTSTLLIPFDF